MTTINWYETIECERCRVTNGASIAMMLTSVVNNRNTAMTSPAFSKDVMLGPAHSVSGIFTCGACGLKTAKSIEYHEPDNVFVPSGETAAQLTREFLRIDQPSTGSLPIITP